MSEYMLMVDSGADLSLDYLKKHADQLAMIPITYTLDGTEYADDAGQTLGHTEFYAKLRSGSKSTTAMINTAAYSAEFSKILDQGKDLIYLALSSGISGSYSAAAMTGEELKAKYPDRSIYIVDSLGASLGIGVLAHAALAKKAEGMSVGALAQWLEEAKHRLCHLFTVSDLMHLQRGGRISRSTAIMGSIIGVKPMLDVDINGKLQSRSKVRGRRQALEALVAWMDRLTEGESLECVGVSHGDCEDDARYVMEIIKRNYKVQDAMITTIGPVIGTHSGPGTVALFFFGKARVD
ncbi:DegV family protein [Oscillospiraceae bacterium OttesenSCG-928-F05]|nr:DegV family protein [Oscillospiraceae bacterium OttesenSCG-928-F05]